MTVQRDWLLDRIYVLKFLLMIQIISLLLVLHSEQHWLELAPLLILLGHRIDQIFIEVDQDFL